MNTIESFHLDWIDVECPTCDAPPGCDCTSLYYGNGYIVTGGHDTRHENASYHLLEQVATSFDGHVGYQCSDCGWEDAN